MAQTTTAINACDVVVSLDNVSGTLTDISGSSNEVSMDLGQNIGEIATFDGDWMLKASCGKTVSVSLNVVYTTTADEGLDILRDWFFATSPGSRTVQIDVPDSTAGSDRYSGEFVIESLNIPLTAGEASPVLVSATLSNDGAFAHSTITT